MNNEEMNKKIDQLVAKTWSDAEFKAKLLANPAETLRAEGIEIPDGVKVTVVENTKEQFYILLPNKSAELSDKELDKASGGIYGAFATVK